MAYTQAILVEDGFEAALTAPLTAVATTATLNTVPTRTSGYLYIYDANGNIREKLKYTGVSGSTVTGLVRGLSLLGNNDTAGTGLAHPSGRVVKMAVSSSTVNLIINNQIDQEARSLTTAQKAAADAATTPSGTNPFATQDDINAQTITDLLVQDAGGINVSINAGRAMFGDTLVQVSAVPSLALTNGATNYVEVSSAGTVSANTSGFTTGRIPLAQVVTVAGDITSLTDKRPFFAAEDPAAAKEDEANTFTQTNTFTGPVVMTGSSSVTVPVPTTDTQASRKDYTDNRVLNQKISLVAGENISADKPAYIYSGDQKLYTAHGLKETADGSTLSSGYETQRCALSPTHFLEVYRSATNTLSVRAVEVADLDVTDTQTVSSALQTASTPIRYAGVARISDTKFIVFFVNTSNAVRYRTGSFNGTTITLDTDTAYSFDADRGLHVANALVDNRCVFASHHSSTVRMRYLNVDTNSVSTVGSELTDTTGTENGLSCCMAGDGTAYAVGLVNGTSGKIFAIDTNTNTNNTPYTVTWRGAATSYAGNAQPSLVPHVDRAFMAWGETLAMTGDDVGYTGIYEVYFSRTAYQAIDVQGSTGASSTRNRVAAYGTRDIIYLPTLSLIYRLGKFYPASLTPSISPPTDSSVGGYAVAVSKDKVIITTSASSHAILDFWTPFDGMVLDAINSGDTGQLSLLMADGQSSLVANRHYYLKDNYSAAGDLDIKGGIGVGVARSATLLTLERYV